VSRAVILIITAALAQIGRGIAACLQGMAPVSSSPAAAKKSKTSLPSSWATAAPGPLLFGSVSVTKAMSLSTRLGQRRISAGSTTRLAMSGPWEAPFHRCGTVVCRSDLSESGLEFEMYRNARLSSHRKTS
jgi:hypothetical protein